MGSHHSPFQLQPGRTKGLRCPAWPAEGTVDKPKCPEGLSQHCEALSSLQAHLPYPVRWAFSRRLDAPFIVLSKGHVQQRWCDPVGPDSPELFMVPKGSPHPARAGLLKWSLQDDVSGEPGQVCYGLCLLCSGSCSHIHHTHAYTHMCTPAYTHTPYTCTHVHTHAWLCSSL